MGEWGNRGKGERGGGARKGGVTVLVAGKKSKLKRLCHSIHILSLTSDRVELLTTETEPVLKGITR